MRQTTDFAELRQRENEAATTIQRQYRKKASDKKMNEALEIENQFSAEDQQLRSEAATTIQKQFRERSQGRDNINEPEQARVDVPQPIIQQEI